MKFHAPSFLLGVGLASAGFAARERLRPVAVEVGALGVHLSRLARGLAARRREGLEDLWAEIEERVVARDRAARDRRAEGRVEHPRTSPTNGSSVAAG